MQCVSSDVLAGCAQSTESLRQTAFSEKVDVVVSCLASRTGGIQARSLAGCAALLHTGLAADWLAAAQDSWDIDYQATLNCLEVARAQARLRLRRLAWCRETHWQHARSLPQAAVP